MCRSLDFLEERRGDAATISKQGEEATLDGSTLRLKEGGAFYASSPLQSVALFGSNIVAGALSGELYHLEMISPLVC